MKRSELKQIIREVIEESTNSVGGPVNEIIVDQVTSATDRNGDPVVAIYTSNYGRALVTSVSIAEQIIAKLEDYIEQKMRE